MAGRDHYACASLLNGGKSACDNDAYLRRPLIEPGLLAGIKRELSAPEIIEELQRRVRQRLKNGKPPTDNRAQIAKLEREVARLVEAIASGALRTSAAIARRLQDAEAALARLKVTPAPPSVQQLLPQLGERCQAAIDNLERTLMVDPRRARMEIAEHVGPIRVTTTPEEIRLEAQKGHMEAALLGATGTGGERQVCVVAGA
jgi:site-specific DNA recombinase